MSIIISNPEVYNDRRQYQWEKVWREGESEWERERVIKINGKMSKVSIHSADDNDHQSESLKNSKSSFVRLFPSVPSIHFMYHTHRFIVHSGNFLQFEWNGMHLSHTRTTSNRVVSQSRLIPYTQHNSNTIDELHIYRIRDGRASELLNNRIYQRFKYAIIADRCGLVSDQFHIKLTLCRFRTPFFPLSFSLHLIQYNQNSALL